MRRCLATVVLMVAFSAAGPNAARIVHACSCVGPLTAESQIGANDIAFVGTPLSEREGRVDDFGVEVDGLVYTFRVDDVLKGQLPATIEIETSGSSSSCGTTFQLGVQVGIATTARREHFSVGLCGGVMSAEDALASARELPAPTSEGPIAAVVAGRWGGANLIGVDARGDPVAYGLGTFATDALALAACPGGRTLVALGHDDAAESSGPEVGPALVLRFYALPSFVQVAEQPVQVKLPNVVPHTFPTTFRCLAEDGSDGIIITSGGDSGPPTVGVLTCWREPAQSLSLGRSFGGAINADGSVAFVVDGAAVEAIDVSTGEFSEIAVLPAGQLARDVAVSPDGSSLIVVAGDEEGQPDFPFAANRLVTIALVNGRVTSLIDVPLTFAPRISSTGGSTIIHDGFDGSAHLLQADGTIGPALPGFAFAEVDDAGTLLAIRFDSESAALVDPAGGTQPVLEKVVLPRAVTAVHGAAVIDVTAIPTVTPANPTGPATPAGPATPTGPATTDPVTSDPATSDSGTPDAVNTDSTITDRSTTDRSTTDPTTTDPTTTGPTTTGPTTTGPTTTGPMPVANAESVAGGDAGGAATLTPPRADTGSSAGRWLYGATAVLLLAVASLGARRFFIRQRAPR